MTGSVQSSTAHLARHEGQAIVIAAASLSTLIAFAALVINTGMLLQEHRHLQNAADASSLAGAHRIFDEQASRSLRDSSVMSALTTLATRNKVDVGGNRQLQASYIDQAGTTLKAAGGGGPFPATASGVQSGLSGPFSTILPPIVSQSAISVQATARAGFVSVPYPTALTNPVPIGVPLAAFLAGQSFDLLDQSVALSSYGVTDYTPYLDLASLSNSGPGYVAATDFLTPEVNQQYWSDGLHTSGQLAIGNTIVMAGYDFTDEAVAGLLDNLRRQGLTDSGGAAYALVDLPLWNQYVVNGTPDGDSITIIGFVRFKILQTEILPTSLRGYFVPYLVPTPGPGSVPGVLWGPSQIKMLR